MNGSIKDRGQRFIESMNACNMIVLNGIDLEAEITCVNTYKGKSVIDYIIVDAKSLETQTQNNITYKPKSIKVWTEEIARISDHRLVTCQLIIPNPELVDSKNVQKEVTESKRRASKWRRRDQGRKSFWDKVEKEAEQILPNWFTEIEKNIRSKGDKEKIEKMMELYENNMNRILDKSVGRAKRKKKKSIKKRLIWDNKVYESIINEKKAYKLWKRNKSDKILREEKQKTKQIRKKMVRKHKRQINKRIIEDIEN